MRRRAGEWWIAPTTADVVILRRLVGDEPVLRLAGELRTPGAICDIIAMIAQSAWRGELVVDAEAGSRTFFFDRGLLVSAHTTVAEERIGEILCGFGVVPRPVLDECAAAAQAQGKRLGEVLIEREVIGAERLYQFMSRQVEEVLYAAMRLGDGSFCFFDRYDDKRILHRSNLNAGALLMEGARRMDELAFFRDKIPSDGYIPVPVAGKEPPEELKDVFSLCDGKRSIQQIGLASGKVEFDVTHAIFRLLGAGVVSVSPPRPEGAEAVVEIFNPALAAIHAAADAAAKGPDLREALERFGTGAGVYDPLFMMAGPHPDGTLNGERVAKNLAALAGEDPDRWLAKLMGDYAGFALFLVESHLPRAEHEALVAKVTKLLEPVRVLEDAAGPLGALTP